MNQQLIQSISAESLPQYSNEEEITRQLMSDISCLFHLEEKLFWDYINNDTQRSLSDLKNRFEQKIKQLKRLLEVATIFMRHTLKIASQEVNQCLVKIHTESIQTALQQYPTIYQSKELKDPNHITLMLIATNILIFRHFIAIDALNAFYDIPHIKQMIGTIFNSFVWYVKQNFTGIDSQLTRIYDRQRRQFSYKIKHIEQIYWQDFPERLKELEKESTYLQRKLSARLILPSKRKKLYQQYQRIQNEINHPFFTEEMD